MEITDEQIQTYRENGYLVVENLLTTDELQALRERFDAIFDGDFQAVVEPDEYRWQKDRDPEDIHRMLAGVWRSDAGIARQAFREDHAVVGAQLEGVDSVRLVSDVAWWKPEGGKPLDVHQDAAFMGWVEPVQQFTCWIPLDDTYADGGTLAYVPGSHKWTAAGGGDPSALRGTAESWLDRVRALAPEGTDVELVPLEIKAGSASFHTSWVWHGSGPNTRRGTIRRSYSIHMIPGNARHHATLRHPAYSRYFRWGQEEFDEGFFPILWSADGSRTSWLDDYCKQTPSSAFAPDAFSHIDPASVNVEPWTRATSGSV